MLSLSERSWKRLPEVAAEIDGWDPEDQVDFVIEWPLEEDRLRRLNGYERDGTLSEEQAARYEALKILVAENRSIIERLLDN